MSSPRRNRTAVVILAVITVLAALLVCLSCCGLGALFGVTWLSDQTGDQPTPPPAAFEPVQELDPVLAQRIGDTPTTDTDYWLLYGELRNPTGDPATRQAVQGPTEYDVGEVHTFWMGDEEQQRYWQIDAQVRVKTDHTYLYVDTETSVEQDDLDVASELFESQIYPTNHRIFGSEWTPGIDNDPRITILVTNQMPFGIAGYFSSTDEYPQEMQPHSNQREMIYVTSAYLGDLDQFGQLLSHEFQHMIHWNQDLSEALWINEGLSLLAEEINGYRDVLGSRQFWRDPDMQLTNWAEDSGDRVRNYAASKLFLSYLAERYGGYQILGELAADPAYGTVGVEDLLRAKGSEADFESVFADWVAANLVGDSGVDGGRYGYALRGESNDPALTARLQSGAEYLGWVSQFGADYVEIDAQPGTQVTFEGSGRAALAAAEPYEGAFAWWSNRRNMLSSSLTRAVDLEGVEGATLHFWTWYDIEADFDYGYVAVSTDDGRTWQTLPGAHTTSADPNKANYGNGYTGKSDGWLEEQVDLGRYSGQRILLRFWYITDPGLNQSGWLVDDIAIPEIGFADDGEAQDSGWTVDGFVRSSNDVPQSYAVQLVEYGPQTTVRHLQLNGENVGRLTLSEGTQRAVLVVSGVTSWTSEPAPYRIEVE